MGLILLPIYTRILSPSEFGILDLMIAFALIANILIAFEIHQGIARFCGSDCQIQASQAYFSSGLFFALINQAIFLTAGFYFADSLSPLILQSSEYSEEFRLGLVYLSTQGIYNIVQNQFRWKGQFEEYAKISIGASVSSLVAIILLTLAFDLGLRGILAGMSLGPFLFVLIGLWKLRDELTLGVDLKRLGEMLRFAIPLVPSSCAVILTLYTDRYLIGYFLGGGEIGIYATAFRVAGLVALVSVGFQSAMTPFIYRYFQESHTPQRIADYLQWYVFFSVIASVSISLLSKSLIFWIALPEFHRAAIVVGPLSLAILISQMYVFAPGLVLAKKTTSILFINLATVALNFLLNILLIPTLGTIGAGIASMLSFLISFLLYSGLGSREYPVPVPWVPVSISLVLAICGTFLPWISAGPWLSWSVASLIFMIAAWCRFSGQGAVKPSAMLTRIFSYWTRVSDFFHSHR